MTNSNRIKQEKKVIAQMIAIYCRRRHRPSDGALCAECDALLNYAMARLDRCPKGEAKSSCRKCDIHCYAPIQRKQVRDVMKYVGPRMLFINPAAAIRHLLNELK